MKNDEMQTDQLDWALDHEGLNDTEVGSALTVGHDTTSTEDDSDLSPELARVEDLRRIALSPQIQALWNAVLPLVGVLPSRPGEFAGMFKVEPVAGKPEATVYIDVPERGYERGVASTMDRVLVLNVRLDHDYRRLGDQHYCVDCEIPDNDTRH
jgi:hypothetical protein